MIFCSIFIQYHIHLITYLSCRKKVKCRKRRSAFSENVGLFKGGNLQYGTFEKEDSQIPLPNVYGKNKRG